MQKMGLCVFKPADSMGTQPNNTVSSWVSSILWICIRFLLFQVRRSLEFDKYGNESNENVNPQGVVTMWCLKLKALLCQICQLSTRLAIWLSCKRIRISCKRYVLCYNNVKIINKIANNATKSFALPHLKVIENNSIN